MWFGGHLKHFQKIGIFVIFKTNLVDKAWARAWAPAPLSMFAPLRQGP